jgi:hypothetical protein
MSTRLKTLAASAGLAIVLGSAGLCSATAAPGQAVRASSSAGTWGRALEVPGLGRLNTGKDADAQVSTVSCPAPGDCAAGGFYSRGLSTLAFVLTERNGTWGKATQVPGLARLNTGLEASVEALSCAKPGYCSASGSYFGKKATSYAFVVTEQGGRWGTAEKVAGIPQGDADALSCPAPGDCVAGGSYSTAQTQPGFVVSEHNGTWGKAIEIPGLARLDVDGQSSVETVSCAKPGYCSAGGYYMDAEAFLQAFVVTERNGRWDNAIEVPGSGRLNAFGDADVTSVSCAAPGDCSAGGSDAASNGSRQGAFVVTERKYRWGKAINLPGSARLSGDGGADLASVSCAKPGFCSAGGIYVSADNDTTQALVVTERRGRWRRAVGVRGSVHLNAGGDAEINSVSCAAPGDCSAGGYYTGKRGDEQALVVTQDGRWGTAIEVPGSARLDIGGMAQVLAVSCAARGHCSAGGFYTDAHGGIQAFVVTER